MHDLYRATTLRRHTSPLDYHSFRFGDYTNLPFSYTYFCDMYMIDLLSDLIVSFRLHLILNCDGFY